ncbi:protein YgfX [Methylovorus glucosotrophus]|uniref:protein YgfX n=1 Tax=Methylovorus glucosotrophus TaxID=266009 RepID=UPI0002EC1D86|nr:protein YgfX [Methylovorus glucosotrophus]
MKPLQVDLRPSPRLTAILMVASASAVLMLLVVPLVWWVKLAGGVAIVVASVRHLRRHAWRSVPEAWLGLRWSTESGWQAWRKDGEAMAITILPDSMVTSALTVIRFRNADQRWPQALVLLADSADAESLRRLRVQLRWAYERTSAEPAAR